MAKLKSLVNGIGNVKLTKKYYNDWSINYDKTLERWNYQAPKKCIMILKQKLKVQPKNILDLACGTGLFGQELKNLYKNSQIYGSDISEKSLSIAKKKKIYKGLATNNFEIKKYYKIKFDLVSMVGSMTYCKNFDNLFSNIKFYLNKKGHFIFSHRTDLWSKQKFDVILDNFSKSFTIKFISRPVYYLPLNNDFKDKIKIKLVLLQKY